VRLFDARELFVAIAQLAFQVSALRLGRSACGLEVLRQLKQSSIYKQKHTNASRRI
jgi:hypothetical protein